MVDVSWWWDKTSITEILFMVGCQFCLYSVRPEQCGVCVYTCARYIHMSVYVCVCVYTCARYINICVYTCARYINMCVYVCVSGT